MPSRLLRNALEDCRYYFLFQKEEKIAVHDRVAFACKYLSDARLLEFIQMLKTELIEEGNLDGILLTGLH